jgi:hypothetical protein
MTSEKKQLDMSWQSGRRIWTWGALCVAVVCFLMMCWVQYATTLNPLEQYYFPATYAKTGVRAQQSPTNRANYEVLWLTSRHGKQLLATPDDVEKTKKPDGGTEYHLTDAALKAGWVNIAFQTRNFNDGDLHTWLSGEVYGDTTLVDLVKWPWCIAVVIFSVLSYFAGIKDGERTLALLRGQRLDGTEALTVAQFNRRMRLRKKVNGPLLDGVMFLDTAQGWWSRIFDNYASRGVYVPREREPHHFVMMGDTGSGKTAAIRQVLLQVQARGELAIVYATSEYVEQFYDPARGDIILNPLDARCPFYSLADEIGDDAEASTLAASLFPKREHENPFFADAPRRIIAYLLCLRPTPEELVYWLCHPEEIDRRVRGTELEAMIASKAPAQREGVLASLGLIADALKLLPKEGEAKGHFSTRAWAKQRRGWIFITTTPDTRESLRPLVCLWIDLLVLHLMRMSAKSGPKTWIFVDELHSLQRLPQLATALTETRKANVVMVLGFQGRAQIIDLYGPLTEALLSQPATKLFFKSSDPDAAGWVSRAIGAVEYLRNRLSRSRQPGGQDSDSQQREIVREPLVMDSRIMGLEPLEVYLKHGIYAVHFWLKYIELPSRHPAFIQRKRVSVRIASEVDQASRSLPASTPTGQQLTPNSTQQQQFFE